MLLWRSCRLCWSSSSSFCSPVGLVAARGLVPLALAPPWISSGRLEGDEQQRVGEAPVVDAADGQLQRDPASVRLDARGPLHDRGIGLHDLAKRGGERGAQAFARHLDDVQVGAAGRQLEIGADAAVDLLDLTALIDDHGRRREALGESPAQRLRQIERGPSQRAAGRLPNPGTRRSPGPTDAPAA